MEKGRFAWPAASPDAVKITLTHEELALLLGGIDLRETQRRPWYRHPVQPEQNRV